MKVDPLGNICHFEGKNPAGTELWTLSLGFQFGVVGFGSGLLSRKNLLNQDMHVTSDTHRKNEEDMTIILMDFSNNSI